MTGIQHVHFIGIGGSGLSAMAVVLLERGFQVSGSDRQASAVTQSLQQAGALIYIGHQSDHIRGADCVVRSSAVPDENVEVQAAIAAGVPVFKRIDFLSQLMEGQAGIAIAGTHGKTTTTAMIAWILTSLGLDPSYVIGGASANLGGNAHSGQGGYFVIEADEYDRMFLGISPNIAVVMNIEYDHPDCYPTPEDYYRAFRAFADRLQPDGVLIVNVDDPGARKLFGEVVVSRKRAVSFSASDADSIYAARDLIAGEKGGFSFEVAKRGELLASLTLQVPGLHNVRNALAALVVADVLGVSVQDAALTLLEYRGTGRRFEVHGEVAGVTFIDDYAHHPTEIRVTLEAVNLRYPGRRVLAVWQPHTFSRTRILKEEFAASFTGADFVIVTEIFASRESPPIDGFSARQIVDLMRKKGHADQREIVFSANLDHAKKILLEKVQEGDVVIVLSAGDADWITGQMIDALGSDQTARTEAGG